MGLSLVFFGTAEFAAPSLRALLASPHPVRAVVTAPPRPAGRGRKLRASPIAEAAGDRVPVLTPEEVNAPTAQEALQAISAELFVVVAYGQILSPETLALASRGAINLHASLLPKYRGAAPVAAAILAGERETGVTTIWMSPQVDAGDAILQRPLPIAATETAGELEARLAADGARLLVETLDRIAAGTAPRQPQTGPASHAPKLHPADFRIAWDRPAAEIERLIRAGSPRTPAWTTFRGERLQILRGQAREWGAAGEGEVLAVEKGGILVGARNGAVSLSEVRPAGKRAMSGWEFANGHRLRAGDRLTPPESGDA